MIKVHKLKGEEIWVNPELLAFIDEGHQSVITLVDGSHIVVSEKPEEIAEIICEHRARILALAFSLDGRAPADNSIPINPDFEEPRHLHPVPAPES